jgi:hypothetical protein
MTKKLDKEHLDEIQTLRDEFAKNTNILGNIALERHATKMRLKAIEADEQHYLDQFENLQKQESVLLEKMRERYGEGQINIADGTFAPAE